MKDEAKILLKLLALAECMDKTMSKSTQDIYLETLGEYEDGAIISAISRAGKECKFFPKPAELIEFIEGPARTAKDESALAWNELIKAIERQGAWKSVIFNERPAIMSVVRAMGGWPQVCQWTEDELHWRQKEFCELYSGLQRTEHPAYLPGIAERNNIATGYKPEPPALADGGNRKVLPMPQRTDREILKQITERQQCPSIKTIPA